MKRNRMIVRFSSVFMALILCMTLLPVGVFAEEGTDIYVDEPAAAELQDQEVETTDTDITDTDAPATEEALSNTEEPVEEVIDQDLAAETKAVGEGALQESLDEETPEEEVTPEVPDGLMPGGKTFTLNNVKVQFKKDVVPDKTSSLKPGRVWVKGQKKSMKVNWVNAKKLDPIYGVIVLRATGTSKVYKEVKTVSFRKAISAEEYEITPKTACTDKSNIKKNTAYTYRVVSYYEKGGYRYVSPISDWAAGQTSASKLKNVYKATINKKSAKLQSGGTVKLKLTVASPKTKFLPSSRRWSSSDKTVAKVSSKGKVTAKAPGTATISCLLASGAVFKCKVTVVGAFKPGTPTLKVDYATTSKIVLVWNKAKNATSYNVYKSDDGLHWDAPIKTKKTTYTFTGLKKNHRYTFYVIARNDNKGLDANGAAKTYHAESSNSNVLNQKAVVKLRPTAVTGFPSKKSLKAGKTLSVSVKVKYPESRKASLQMKVGKKWTTKKTIALPKGTGTSKVTITFPSDWWSAKSVWRLYIPKNKTATAYTSGNLTITPKRVYQNPSSYVQIKNSIGKHGYSHYVSPVLVGNTSTKSDHIEALIKTANKYKGNKYAQSKSGAPGKGIDESGLVIQACYGAGVDLWPISPSTRPYNCVPSIMDAKLAKVSYGQPTKNDFPNVYRGDLVFFAESKGGTAISVAIYTGNGGVFIADVKKGVVRSTNIMTLLDDYKYHVVGVRRIFN